VPRVFLCGLMGAGKSTVGKLLARKLSVPFRDLDREIELEAGSSVAEIFHRESETGFRERESLALQRVIAGGDCDSVVALGGGALIRPENLALVLAAGRLVWLDAPTPELLRRLGDSSSRPLLGQNPAEALERMRGQRDEHYMQAQLCIDTQGLLPERVVAQIVGWLGA